MDIFALADQLISENRARLVLASWLRAAQKQRRRRASRREREERWLALAMAEAYRRHLDAYQLFLFDREEDDHTGRRHLEAPGEEDDHIWRPH